LFFRSEVYGIDIEWCMKCYDCKRCIKNRECESEYQKAQKGVKQNEKDLQDVRDSGRKSRLSTQTATPKARR